jgi:hypothetical protein
MSNSGHITVRSNCVQIINSQTMNVVNLMTWRKTVTRYQQKSFDLSHVARHSRISNRGLIPRVEMQL